MGRKCDPPQQWSMSGSPSTYFNTKPKYKVVIHFQTSLGVRAILWRNWESSVAPLILLLPSWSDQSHSEPGVKIAAAIKLKLFQVWREHSQEWSPLHRSSRGCFIGDQLFLLCAPVMSTFLTCVGINPNALFCSHLNLWGLFLFYIILYKLTDRKGRLL